jgi:hypothetical protein
MTVGEMIDELKKYDQLMPIMFVSNSDEEGFVRLILIDDLRISNVFLAPHGGCCLLVCELAGRLSELDGFSGSEVFFLTQANEVAPVYRVSVSVEDEFVVLSGKK